MVACVVELLLLLLLFLLLLVLSWWIKGGIRVYVARGVVFVRAVVSQRIRMRCGRRVHGVSRVLSVFVCARI